jgi:hypothetical protein
MSNLRTTLGAALAVLPLLIAPQSAQAAAGYVNNADQWGKLTAQEKAAYVQGLNDTANFVYTNDDLQTGIVKAARTRCLIQTKMAPNLLSDVITNGYAKIPQLRNQAPIFVYISRLSDICRPIINEERARFSLPPL